MFSVFWILQHRLLTLFIAGCPDARPNGSDNDDTGIGFNLAGRIRPSGSIIRVMIQAPAIKHFTRIGSGPSSVPSGNVIQGGWSA